MEQKTIDKLVERLGMTPALAPLLNSGNGYERFETALNDSLNDGLNTMPKIKIKKRVLSFKRFIPRRNKWVSISRHEAYLNPNISGPYGNIVGDKILRDDVRMTSGSAVGLRGMTPQKYAEAVDMFRKYFGLGEGRVSMGEIASRYDVTRGFVGQNVDFVAKYLKQRFSKDLWYGTI